MLQIENKEPFYEFWLFNYLIKSARNRITNMKKIPGVRIAVILSDYYILSIIEYMVHSIIKTFHEYFHIKQTAAVTSRLSH